MLNDRHAIGNLPNQFGGSRNVVSWKQQEIKIPSNGLVTVHFDDTKPNQFLLQNPNHTVIHVGITKMPSADSYEFKVNANSSRTFGRPTATDVLYLLNKGSAECSVHLFSVFDKFDMTILQTMEVDLASAPTFDGIITGFGANAHLPQGQNHIGEVTVRTLPEGQNHIGKVTVTELPEGQKHIGKVTIEEGEKAIAVSLSEEQLDALAHKIANLNQLKGMAWREINDATEMKTFEFPDIFDFQPTHILLLENTGASDIVVTIECEGYEMTCDFTLKAGERFENLPITFNKISFDSGEPFSARLFMSKK